ncbi:hypothetical protein DAEQUDRAFT_147343 [Daedalea quercina L-15889]|uniref:Uncharacterized protein n=1 Tax=Daedalea quercina L-15889 TaxID=1314783 RepID=A0A165KN31_9APHY|nr:hypothetical protein DAEQUDRAFT_147343 [Daedalea quercina L-15889]
MSVGCLYILKTKSTDGDYTLRSELVAPIAAQRACSLRGGTVSVLEAMACQCGTRAISLLVIEILLLTSAVNVCAHGSKTVPVPPVATQNHATVTHPVLSARATCDPLGSWLPLGYCTLPQAISGTTASTTSDTSEPATSTEASSSTTSTTPDPTTHPATTGSTPPTTEPSLTKTVTSTSQLASAASSSQTSSASSLSHTGTDTVTGAFNTSGMPPSASQASNGESPTAKVTTTLTQSGTTVITVVGTPYAVPSPSATVASTTIRGSSMKWLIVAIVVSIVLLLFLLLLLLLWLRRRSAVRDVEVTSFGCDGIQAPVTLTDPESVKHAQSTPMRSRISRVSGYLREKTLADMSFASNPMSETMAAVGRRQGVSVLDTVSPRSTHIPMVLNGATTYTRPGSESGLDVASVLSSADRRPLTHLIRPVSPNSIISERLLTNTLSSPQSSMASPFDGHYATLHSLIPPELPVQPHPASPISSMHPLPSALVVPGICATSASPVSTVNTYSPEKSSAGPSIQVASPATVAETPPTDTDMCTSFACRSSRRATDGGISLAGGPPGVQHADALSVVDSVSGRSDDQTLPPAYGAY